MPRINRVDKAQKSPGKCGHCGKEIAAGEPYLWWKFRRSGKYIRCGETACAPKGSDLTQSPYFGTLAKIQENLKLDGDTLDALESERDDLVEQLNSLRDEQEEKLNNMPEGLQQGSTGELLQERMDTLESAVSDLEGIDFSEPDTDEVKAEGQTKEEFDAAVAEQLEQKLEELRDEIRNVVDNIS